MAGDPIPGTNTLPSLDEQLDWAGLVSFVRARTVVPVVGKHLLEIDVDGRTVTLEAWIAERLAERIRVPTSSLPPSPTLRDVWARAAETRGALAAIRPALRGVLERADLPEPPALADLVAITDLSLFVSTTVDSALERAAGRIRGGDTDVLCADPDHPERADLPTPDMPAEGTTIFAMLGRVLSEKTRYAVTDEDVLERVTLLLQHDRRPRNLFSVLANSNLLFLGCGLPDWLARFVLRGLRDAPLSARNDLFSYLVDARAEPDLVLFLENNNLKCLVSANGPRAFVAELHRRWQAGRPAGSVTAGNAADRAGEGAAGAEEHAAPSGVFLSYAREDKAEVDKLAAFLDDAGVPVWLDRRSLQPGDHWDDRIAEAVSRCDAFVACASKNVVRQAESYLYKEWRLALEREKTMAFGEHFIFPVALDDLDLRDPHLQPLEGLQWTFFAGEAPAAARDALRRTLDTAVKRRRMKGRFT